MWMQIWQESQTPCQTEIFSQEQGQTEEEIVTWGPRHAVGRVSRTNNHRMRWCWCYCSSRAAVPLPVSSVFSLLLPLPRPRLPNPARM
jgi:hypothetical protein